jgi:hypothetical protein
VASVDIRRWTSRYRSSTSRHGGETSQIVLTHAIEAGTRDPGPGTGASRVVRAINLFYVRMIETYDGATWVHLNGATNKTPTMERVVEEE